MSVKTYHLGLLPFAVASLCCLVAIGMARLRQVPPPASEVPSSVPGDYSRKSRRSPQKPDAPLPAAPTAPKGAVEFVVNAISLISDEVGRRRGGCGNVYFGGSRFLFERDFHYREARLLASVYPEAAELVAEELLGAKDASVFEQNMATRMLGALAERGNRRAELLLLRQAGAKPNDPARESALSALHEQDRGCVYEPFYREQWRIGGEWARGMLDLVPDRTTIELLQKASSDPAQPDYVREDVGGALARLRLLQSSDAETRLAEIIIAPPIRARGEEEAKQDRERRWALRAARVRDLDLRSLLRRRLDRDLEAAREERLPTAYARRPFAEEFRDDVFLFPSDWDDVLVAYAEMGGAPNVLERERLREFGFLCDPKVRLQEILEGLKKAARR